MLSTKVSSDGRARKVKVGYKECRAGKKQKSKPLTEIQIDVQWLVFLVPTNKMELLKDVAADDAAGHDLAESFKKASLERMDVTKDEAPDELFKVIAADAAIGHDLKGVAKEACLEGTCETEGDDPEEKLEDADAQKDAITDEAAGHNLRKHAKETRLGVITANVPRQRNQRPKKRTEKGWEFLI